MSTGTIGPTDAGPRPYSIQHPEMLTKLGEKVAGEAGKVLAGDAVDILAKPAVEKAVGFLTGLLLGDAKAATKNISKEDYIEV